jgi:hypothetical protein
MALFSLHKRRQDEKGAVHYHQRAVSHINERVLTVFEAKVAGMREADAGNVEKIKNGGKMNYHNMISLFDTWFYIG